MRWLKIGLYILLILVLQTVVFARLNFWGAVPDLVLVSVIIFAVLDKGRVKAENALLFATGSGFLQDILSHGIYMHTISKVIICSLVRYIKESYVGNEYFLVVGMVAIFTPLTLVAEAGVFYFLYKQSLSISYMFSIILLTTIYNLIMVPIFSPLIGRLNYD